MNTQAFGAFGSTSTQAGGLGLGLSFQDFPASQQDNYLEFADFSQVLTCFGSAASHALGLRSTGCTGAG